MTTEASVNQDTVCAGFIERLIAVIIDGLILLIPNIIFSQVIGGVIGSLLSLALSAGYVIYFWSSSGATPGKALMGLKVVSADGGTILTPGNAALRWVGTIISAIPIFLGYLWVIWDPKHEAWHDKIAKTKVIKVK
jgi:uncharacterized RDD family membrane protein YckC